MSILTELEAAECQLAAETKFDAGRHPVIISTDAVLIPMTDYSTDNLTGQLNPDNTGYGLEYGNGVNSKLSAPLAKDFAKKFRILYYHPDDNTGLAFTVMQKYLLDADGNPTTPDPNGVVISVRSTEFAPATADGAAFRDPNDTSADWEISFHGYAYAQIASLDALWNGSGGNPGIKDQITAAVGSEVNLNSIQMTGYSLGGNVAAGFAQLNQDSVSQLM